jgi:hypothetical protein
MKNQIRFFSLAFLIVFSFSFNKLTAQNCLVMVDELVGTYKGKCKKGYAHGKGKAVGIDTYEGKFYEGLPHGRGTYTWANGDTYSGQWKKGKRDGIGVFKFKINETDTILDGVWLADEYIGPKPKPPLTLTKYNIDNVRYKKKSVDMNRVLITFKQNGMVNNKITNFSIISTSGVDTNLGISKSGYENVTFPVKIKITYTTPNKIGSTSLNCNLEFEIFEPGDWEVEVVN